MTGLVIDGGMTFVQRRDMQNVADAAALAGAYDFENNSNVTTAEARAKSVTAANGYVDGQDGVVVTVMVSAGDAGASDVQVDISKPHGNYFSGVVGFSSWGVSTTATAQAGAPNAAVGAMPIIINKKAIQAHGFGNNNEISFDEPGSGNQDVPQTADSFNWTVFCTANGNSCNGDSSQVDDLITGTNDQEKYVDLGMAIGPLNAGAHTTLFSDLADYVGQSFPIAIVDDSGNLVSIAMFHLTGSVGGSTKQIRGYFEAPVNSPQLHIKPGVGAGSSLYGTYSVRLTN